MPHLSPADPPHRLSRVALPAAVILLAGWFAFSPALHGDWLWDDNSEITTNVELRDPAGWWKAWLAPATQDYFPLKTDVQWVQWRLWHEHSTLGYHVTNLALHLSSALLLWHLLRKLGLRFAWLGGLLFAIHPLTVESVAWIAELKNMLSLPLLLLALCAWVDFDERRRTADYVRALAFFLAAMCAKSSVVLTPFVLLLHSWWKRRRIDRTDLKAAAPFFAVSLLLGLVTLWFQQHRAINAWEIPLGGFGARLSHAGIAVGFYFSKFIWPLALVPIYAQWSPDFSVVGLLLWLAFAGAAFWFWRRRTTWGRHALLGCGWFVLQLMPILGLVKMSYLHIAPVADHFAYVPIIGLIGLAIAAIEWARASRLRNGIAGFVLLIAALLTLSSRRYADVFASPEKLWSHTLQANPETWLAPNNLGVLRLRDQKWKEAAGLLETAVRLSPNDAPARLNLASALAHLGRVDEAIGQGLEAVRLDPDSTEAHFNLANVLAQANRLSEAIAQFDEALLLSPNATDVRFNLANALIRTGRLDDAITHLNVIVTQKPDSFEVHLNLGNALAASNRPANALSHLLQAAQIAPDSAEVQYGIADLLAQTGRIPESLPHFEQALRFAPDNADIQVNFGDALLHVGRNTEATAHYEAALRLQPGHPGARTGLSRARASRPPQN